MKATKRWARRLVHSLQIAPVDGPTDSTLGAFFAGIRWSEAQDPGGRPTLRLPSM